MSAEKPPVAIRITRPYQSEDELLARELDTISRTGVVLVGAQPRPEGVILRFELALASGAALLRGEGRVIGYKPAAVGHEPGLAVRFTRLDSKSKALVDRVTTLREARRSEPPQAGRRDRERSVPPPAASVRPPAPSIPPSPTPTSSAEIPVTPASSADVLPVSSQPAPQPSVAQTAPIDMDREAILARLRERAARIDQSRMGEILAAGAARRQRA
ncbi:MAG TPA: hypothetical protein VGH28_28835 [Polyangiaceae bacterium]